MTVVIEHFSSTPGSRASICASALSPALALALATLFWSGNFVVGRALRDSIDPLTLNFLRWMLALGIIAPFVWRSTLDALPALRREWRLILALGGTGIATFHVLVYLALQSTTATSALLILSLAPIATLVGSTCQRMEWPRGRQICGALMSISGACLLITRGDFGVIVANGFSAGDLWMLAAVVIWAAYSLLLRHRPSDLPSPVALAASIAVALALMLPLLLLGSATPVAALTSVGVLLSVGYIALFASAIAFLLWSRGVSQLGPVRAGEFVHLMPVFGAGLAFIVLGEVPGLAQVGGALLVLTGIVLAEHPATRSQSWRSFGAAAGLARRHLGRST
jgi:drug/metabolite transporter (DMT)-like permease